MQLNKTALPLNKYTHAIYGLKLKRCSSLINRYKLKFNVINVLNQLGSVW